MPSISRQYHPQSCRLEITAQTSPLSRWAGRPMLKSVQFLVSFREISAANHQPLEIRGNHEQLQLLCETVSNYVQRQLGQPFAPLSGLSATEEGTQAENTAEPRRGTDAAPLYLRPRSVLIHDLVLGPLSTNAEQQTISLKASQLFDLVSALDDCSAELAILPLARRRRRPPLPVWASSAAVIVLLLGLSTATLQLTQRQPALEREWITASDPKEAPTQSAAEPEPITEPEKLADPETTVLSQDQVQPPSAAAPRPKTTSPPAPASDDHQDREQIARPSTSQSSPPAVIARAPRQQAPASVPTPSLPAEPQTQNQPPSQDRPPAIDNNQPLPNPSSSLPTAKELEVEVEEKEADQNPSQRLQEPVAKAPSAAKFRSKTSPPATASSPSGAATSGSEEAAETSAASESDMAAADSTAADSTAADSTETDSSQGNPAPQFESFNPPKSDRPETAADIPESAYVQDIRQYLDSRWRVPTGLNQPLRYQLTLNVNGSLKQIQPLDQVATQYLAQVPLPTVNQPFIAPLQSSHVSEARLILQPDGTVQVFESRSMDPAP